MLGFWQSPEGLILKKLGCGMDTREYNRISKRSTARILAQLFLPPEIYATCRELFRKKKYKAIENQDIRARRDARSDPPPLSAAC